MKITTFFLMFLAAMAAFAEPAIYADQQQCIEQARNDLREKLQAQVVNLKISEKKAVSSLRKLKPGSARFALAAFKGVQESEPEFIDDLCIIRGILPIEEVIKNLCALAGEKDARLLGSISNISHYAIGAIRVAGAAALPPKGASYTTLGADNGLEETLRALKGNVQQKYAAMQAAELDARARLAGIIHGITMVQDDPANPASHTFKIQGQVKGAKIKRYFAISPDLIGCEMTAPGPAATEMEIIQVVGYGVISDPAEKNSRKLNKQEKPSSKK